MERIAAQAGAPFRVIGRAGGERLTINADGQEHVSQPLAELESLWRDSLGKRLQVEVLATAAE